MSDRESPIEKIKASSMGAGIKPILPASVNHTDDRKVVRARWSAEWNRLTKLFQSAPPTEPVETPPEVDENIHPEKGYQFKDNSRRRKMR